MPKPPPIGYTGRSEGFIRMRDEAKTKKLEVVVVAHPSVIGDSYEEIIESLSSLAGAKLALTIAESE